MASAYQEFVKKHRKAGVSMSDVAKMWRESGMAKPKPTDKPKRKPAAKPKGGGLGDLLSFASPVAGLVGSLFGGGGDDEAEKQAKQAERDELLRQYNVIHKTQYGTKGLHYDVGGGALKMKRGKGKKRVAIALPPSVPVDRTFSYGTAPFPHTLNPHEREVFGARMFDSGQGYQGVGMAASNTMRTGNSARYGVGTGRGHPNETRRESGGSFTSFINNMASGIGTGFTAPLKLFGI